MMMMNMMIECDDNTGILNSDKHDDDSNIVVNVDYDSDSCYGCLYNHHKNHYHHLYYHVYHVYHHNHYHHDHVYHHAYPVVCSLSYTAWA